MKILRHSSLQEKVIYRITKLQSWGHDGKLDIFIQKIKVKKGIFFFIFWTKCLIAYKYTLHKRRKI